MTNPIYNPNTQCSTNSTVILHEMPSFYPNAVPQTTDPSTALAIYEAPAKLPPTKLEELVTGIFSHMRPLAVVPYGAGIVTMVGLDNTPQRGTTTTVSKALLTTGIATGLYYMSQDEMYAVAYFAGMVATACFSQAKKALSEKRPITATLYGTAIGGTGVIALNPKIPSLIRQMLLEIFSKITTSKIQQPLSSPSPSFNFNSLRKLSELLLEAPPQPQSTRSPLSSWMLVDPSTQCFDNGQHISATQTGQCLLDGLGKVKPLPPQCPVRKFILIDTSQCPNSTPPLTLLETRQCGLKPTIWERISALKSDSWDRVSSTSNNAWNRVSSTATRIWGGIKGLYSSTAPKISSLALPLLDSNVPALAMGGVCFEMAPRIYHNFKNGKKLIGCVKLTAVVAGTVLSTMYASGQTLFSSQKELLPLIGAVTYCSYKIAARAVRWSPSALDALPFAATVSTLTSVIVASSINPSSY